MPELFEKETKDELQKIFESLVSPVQLLFFTQKNACGECVQQKDLLEHLASMSNKLELKVYDFVINGEEAGNYRVDKIPATVVVGNEKYGIRFFGVTTGYEFTSLMRAIVMVSTGTSGLDPALEMLVQNIKEKVHIQVMVTLTCSYCPLMVHVAHQFAFVNNNILADMVEITEFPHLSQKYNVTAVPKTIINGVYSFEGAIPAAEAYFEIMKAVNPEQYGPIEKAISELKASRKVKLAEEGHDYEVIVVGGGPAAMSAAVYAVRKGLDVALIAQKFGGQITYTAEIDNYLGLHNISGIELNEKFRDHLESFPISEALGTNMVEIKKEDKAFLVSTDDNRKFKARSIIYCAGKEYRRMGLPGEDQLIGKGIGFCATCDAPLYKNRRIAVVGGGNSAFTAVHDLLDFASEIHLVHRRKEFTADATLVQEILSTKKVTVHTQMVVKSFLGQDKLTGIRLESVDGKDRFDLTVDGVFLEIGLSPNTKPLKGFLELNEREEITTNKDQSTIIDGFFAAGDVTDVREKQISISVGQGALAALSAHKYLVKNKLTNSRIGLKESWE